MTTQLCGPVRVFKPIIMVFCLSVALSRVYLYRHARNQILVTKSTRHIPHACPSGFDKINDTQYDWFEKNVVQRSPIIGDYTKSALHDEILILVMISNCEIHLKRFFQNLCSFTFPHQLISIALAEDSSRDQTFETAQQMANQLRPFFKGIEIIRTPNNTVTWSGHPNRHAHAVQFQRRRQTAMVRNRLLMHGLEVVAPEARWVLWLDVDIRHMPRELLKHLIGANQSVVSPTCLAIPQGRRVINYDLFVFQETNESRARIREMEPDFVMLEGAGVNINRRYLYQIRNEGDVVPIDGASGCAFLVEAELHRNGLNFPPYPVDHHIEMEGFTKSVLKFGAKAVGLPFVSVFHDWGHRYTWNSPSR